MQKKIITGILILMSVAAKAQLSLPKGNVLNLVTGTNFLYEQTGIFFYTGKNKITDYNYEKIYDSIDTRWGVSSCMNGNCLGMPFFGAFIKDFGLNDTTGFIRFHVWTYDSSGKSRIVYRVVNNLNFADQVILEFNITFKKPNGIKEIHTQNNFTVYPNPSNGIFEISNLPETPSPEISVFNIEGKEINNSVQNISRKNFVDLRDKPKGIYLLKVSTPESVDYRKLMIY